MADFLDYSHVSMESRGAMMDGRLRLTDEKIMFKTHKTGKTETIERGDIELVNWQRLAGTWGIRLFTGTGELHRFAGFKDGEREKLARFFKQTYDCDMLDRELSVKGHNWGNANFDGAVMRFEVGKADGFEIPLKYVNQCVAGKNEATLEFHLNEDAAVNLSEMRFYIPASETADGEDPVEAFREKVVQKASIVTTSGDAIAIFREISCLSPRGRYDFKIFPTFFHLHGKTFDYKIPASSVMRLFLLPHKDRRQMHFAVNVDPPIKQGQTRYHYLVFNFKPEEEEEIELPFTDEELQEKYDGKLQREITGPTYEVISTILKAIVKKKVVVPGSFIGFNGSPALTCSHKAASGFLYPLEKGLIYIYKPPIFVRYDEIRHVVFERSGGSTRSFDVGVITINDIEYTFSSIEKNEYGKLYEYFKGKKITIKTSGKGAGGTLTWDDDVKIDHYLDVVKREAEELTEGSMSSDDTDFNPDLLEALSAKEEYDSEPSTTSDEGSDGKESGSDAERRRQERKKKKAEREEKRSQRKEKRERKVKKTKLPGQPKRALSAYFLWMNENRDKIKEKNPGLSITEIGRKAGELWKALADKSEWEQKAAEDRKRYEAEMEKWKAEGGLEKLKALKRQEKAAKRAAQKGSSSASSSKSKQSSAPKPVSSSAGTGAGFKSKEFIEDSDSSSNNSDNSNDDNTSSKSKAKKAVKDKGIGKKSKPKPPESDQEMKSEGKCSSEASNNRSDDDSD